jgi:hypothetical protein
VHLETALSLAERFQRAPSNSAFLDGTLSMCTLKKRFPWQNAFKVHLQTALFLTKRFQGAPFKQRFW